MSNRLLKTTALAVAMGLSTSASAGFNFDVNGDTAGGGLIFPNLFDWFPDNALFEGAVPIPSAPGTVDFIFRAQGRLGSFGGGGALDAGAEITFVLEIPSTATLIASGVGFEIGRHGTLTGGSMSMYYDNTGAGGLGTTGGLVSNDITGTGYDDGRLIGSADISTQIFSTFGTVNILDAPDGLPLDLFGVNNQAPITTEFVSGNINYGLEWTFLDDSFFVDVQDPGGLANMKDPLGDDASWSSDTLAAFLNANPSDMVGGVAPNYGDTVNDNLCTVSGSPCDLHAEADARSPFNVDNPPKLPEPASLGLLGLGLLGLGAIRRRRAA